MKYNVGDRVRIKSLDWYNANKSKSHGTVICGGKYFDYDMREWCGKTMTILEAYQTFYIMEEDWAKNSWTDEMIEGLVEEENNDCEKCSLTHNSTRCLFMDNCPHNKQKNIIEILEGYIFKDENGNVINATRIVLEKKKKEYPKTYKECAEIIAELTGSDCNPKGCMGYMSAQLTTLQKLLICRDAYWKIAGEEMGLGKPWEPDCNIRGYYAIARSYGNVIKTSNYNCDLTFVFPTEEMRDAFKENFDPDIEVCKEFL